MGTAYAEQYTSIFRELGVDADSFMHDLTDQSLLQDFHIVVGFHRSKILRKRDEFIAAAMNQACLRCSP